MAALKYRLRPGADTTHGGNRVETLDFVDLCAGIGGFHLALRHLGHECVYAAEIDEELRRLYTQNFPGMEGKVGGDIRDCKDEVPDHDVLCAGFPCQPFSKSGDQAGFLDKTRGTVFHEILEVLEANKPTYVILENVGNFERHDDGRTWEIVKKSLQELGYNIRGTEHKKSGGHGLISPHHLGYPQHRERFFAVASLEPLPADPFPPRERGQKTTLRDIVQPSSELSPEERMETALSWKQARCIDHWDIFVKSIPEDLKLPSFPIWGDEVEAKYPYKETTPHACSVAELREHMGAGRVPKWSRKKKILQGLPSYAQREQVEFPDWKVRYIEKNRKFWAEVRSHLPDGWISGLKDFPPSLRKFEWNCKGEERDLYQHVLQFRPSGLRVKRFSSAPALVSMTTTQIPILGPERRFLTRTEGLKLQGFPAAHQLPDSKSDAFSSLGNAVHVGLAAEVAYRLFRATGAGMGRNGTGQDDGGPIKDIGGIEVTLHSFAGR